MKDGRFKLAAGIRVREVGEEMLVLDDRNGQIHQLNTTASFIWRQFDGNTTVSAITERLVDQFQVDDVVAADDVMAIVDRLRELNLLED